MTVFKQSLFMDCLLVNLRHLPPVLCHRGCLVIHFLSHLSQNLHERRNLDILGFFCRLNSHYGRCSLHVDEGVHHEILLLVNEALANFLDLFLGWVLLVEELYVLTSRYLSFLENFFIVSCKSNFVTVNERIILAHFPYPVVHFLSSSYQEAFFLLEIFLLDAPGNLDVVVLSRYEQEFLDKSRRGRHANEFQDCLKALVNLPLEGMGVLYDTEMGVSHVSID